MSPLIQAPISGVCCVIRSWPKFVGISTANFSSPLRRRDCDLIGRRDVGLAVEIFRGFEAVQELPALERPVLIEDGVAQMLDVERDAVADGEHQDDRIEDRESDPHRIAHDLHRFAARDRPKAGRC